MAARFVTVQRQVESLVLARGDLTAATELIYEVEGLDEEERAALWLLGWSLLPDSRQRRAQQLAHEGLDARL